MRFLIDHDVYAVTAQFIAGLGHDVVRASEAGLAQASDEDLLKAAHPDRRILVTRDRDFENLVFALGAKAGVVYLRVEPATVDLVDAEMERILGMYGEDELISAFLVIEPGRHRIRRPNP